MPDYYSYQPPNPSLLNLPTQGHWENPADWPRTFLYVSNSGNGQGIHPPAPVYQSTQPAQQAMYYFTVSNSDFSISFFLTPVRVAQMLRPATTSTESTMEPLLPLCPMVGPTLLHTPFCPHPRALFLL